MPSLQLRRQACQVSGFLLGFRGASFVCRASWFQAEIVLFPKGMVLRKQIPFPVNQALQYGLCLRNHRGSKPQRLGAARTSSMCRLRPIVALLVQRSVPRLCPASTRSQAAPCLHIGVLTPPSPEQPSPIWPQTIRQVSEFGRADV